MKLKKKNINQKHYEKSLLLDKKNIKLGYYSAREWISDPKHLIFSLSRYKFVSKMLKGKKNVLEIGAGDGFKSTIVNAEVNKLDLNDVVQSAKDQFKLSHMNNNEYFIHDFVKAKFKKKYDAIYALDVIEHIKKKNCDQFVKNIKSSLKSNGVLIIGCPSLTSQQYVSKEKQKRHVNCMDKDQLENYLSKFFKNVFTFGMNDEVLHTGYNKMCHYVFAICV